MEIFSGTGNSYLLSRLFATISPLVSISREWHGGCNCKGQTKWRASGRFRMDLTARDPSKVPRCILGCFAACAKPEPGVDLSTPVRKGRSLSAGLRPVAPCRADQFLRDE